MQILLLLLDHTGELVTREQIQNKLWAPDTYVDFDNAINSAMRKLREALGDDSGDPRFIETFARRRYRFIGSIEAPPQLAAQPRPPIPVPRKSRKGLVLSACGVILVLAAASGWWLRRSVAETKAAPLIPVPLTAAPGWELDPTLSPHGNQVVYAWREGRDAVTHIYVKLIGEGKPARLTSGPRYDSNPVWSPDGRAIAFRRALNQTSGIYTIATLGGAERQVGEGQFRQQMAWSPDGRFLAVSDWHPQTESASLSLIRVENGDRLALVSPPVAKTEDVDPAFSPDGRLLLFTRTSGDYHSGLYLQDLAAGYRPSGDPRLLRQESGEMAGATWTANGSEVVYALSEDAGPNYHLMRIRAQAGSQPERLPFTGEGAMEPSIAPRGNRLVYLQLLDDVDIWQVEAGKPPRSFISSTRWEGSPQYSPDGQRVAFSSDRSGWQQVWVCDGNGRNPVQLTHLDAGPSGTPRWSPDGHGITFDHQEMDGWRIYVMASDGGQVRRLAQDKGDSIIPSWSGDGKWIYYSNNQTGRREIWKRAWQGGEGIQLTHSGGWVAFESHDRQSLYYEKETVPGLWVLPFGGGEEKKFLESIWRRSFVVMDDGIYYIPVPAADGSTTVRFRSFAKAQDTEIARIKDVWLVSSPANLRNHLA